MGQIADTLTARGDLAAARVLQEERLAINQRLGDADGVGASLWDLAQLDLAEEKIAEAAPSIIEAYSSMVQLGRADAIAVIGMRMGQVRAASQQPHDAREVLNRSAAMFRKLGREPEAGQAEALMRQLNPE